MATAGFLEGLSSVGSSGDKEKKKTSSFAFAAQGKGREKEQELAGDTSRGIAPLLSVLGSHRFETSPGSAKIRRVKKRA